MRVDVNTVARALELSPRRVQQLVNDGWIPRERPGLYVLSDCLTAYAAYLEDVQDGGEIAAFRARKAAAKAEMREIDLAVEAGELVEMEAEGERRGEQLTEARSRLLNLPSIAPRVVALDRDRREEIIRGALERAVEALEESGE